MNERDRRNEEIANSQANPDGTRRSVDAHDITESRNGEIDVKKTPKLFGR